MVIPVSTTEFVIEVVMPTTELYTTEPPPIPAGVDLRVYSNPICPFAQVS